MSENQTTPAADELDLDLDAWIAGGARKAHYVTLYARADLLADIEELERRAAVETQADLEPSLGGGKDSGVSELTARIHELYRQLDASKREFRVTGMSETELEEIREEVRRDCKDTLDAVAAEARNAAKDTVRRMGNLSALETNNVLRAKAVEAASKFVENESSVRALARTTSTKTRGEWVQVNEDQFRRMLQIIGAQVELLNRAFSRASNEAPVVTVPKS